MPPPTGYSVSELLTPLQIDLTDRYALERELGRGGMATVYLARDLKHDRMVALKVLRPELAVSVGVERFLREIRLTAALQHPQILPLLDSGTITDGSGTSRPYYTMPYVAGESLRKRLSRERQLAVEEAVRIAKEVAGALGYAHDHGVVHRDIKPENILLSGGHAMVADFGIARAVSTAGEKRLTETGLALGTPAYMSPEQATGDSPIDGRADIYSLGCVLYEMLTGEPPFTGPTAQAVIVRRMVHPVPMVRALRETVPEGIERAVTRALAKSPADRFASASKFAEALADEGPQPSSSKGHAGPRWRTAEVAVFGLALLAAALFWARPRGARLMPSTSVIAVLPFTPSGPDSALSRLGRDLVFTLSAELDGLGGLRVVDPHTVLAQATHAGLSSAAEEAALARQFGAGSIVRGSLVRQGADVLLDFVLAPVDSDGVAAPLGRASVTGPADSVAALTDSVVRLLLKHIWARGSPPSPSLDGALKTRSVEALRAFLEGEQEIAGGQWSSAAVSYSRARDADPSFWLAYARELFARNWTLESPSESLIGTLQRHLRELPERERLTTEAIVGWSSDSVASGLERAREITERYPSSWFGWLIYADELLHNGPLLGHPRAEARAGFARALELNPHLIPVYEHLLLLAFQDRDTVEAHRSLRALEQLDAWSTLAADGYGNRRLQFHFLDAIEGGDSALARLLADSSARDSAPAAVPDGSFYDPFRYGLLAEQIRVSRQVVNAEGPGARQAVHRRLLALSLAGRGAWDSALVALDRLSTSGTDSRAALRAYGLAVVGGWLGALDRRAGDMRRSAAIAAAGSDGADLNEVTWLDGLGAATRRDRQALAKARSSLTRSGDSGWAALERSLGAFDAELRGPPLEAGKAMAALEWQEAALAAPDFAQHPYAVAVDRIAAARWLAAAGQLDEAARLLVWIDGPYFLHPSTVYSIMLTGPVDLERGRIEGRLGHAEPARKYFREFLRRYDLPMPGQRHLVDEARAALGRLAK